MAMDVDVLQDMGDLLSVSPDIQGQFTNIISTLVGVQNRAWFSQNMDEHWGLPPVGHLGQEDGQLKLLLQRSFPILRLTPLNTKPTNTATNYQPNGPQGGEYRFYCWTEGSMNISHSNEYGPSNIEEGIQNSASHSGMGDLVQFAASSGPQNKIASGFRDMVKTATDKFINNGGIEAMIGKLELNATTKDMLNQLAGFGAQMVSSMMGARIDLPNIWKDSKSEYGIKVQIKLHSFGAGNADFEANIMRPLRALCMLAFPQRLGSGGFGVTYVNPPYLEAQLEGLFHSKLCGITNMTIDFPFKRTSMWMGRPLEVDVELTITDMYSVIVYDTKASSGSDPAPTTYSILDGLKKDDVHISGAPSFFEKALILGYDQDLGETGDENVQASNEETRFNLKRYQSKNDNVPAGYESPSRFTANARLDVAAASADTHPGTVDNGDLSIPYKGPRNVSGTRIIGRED
jgi:hypothetical protein